MADTGPKKAGLWSYIASAFTFRWNLLFFGGAMAAALLLPSPDIVMPVLVAGELAATARMLASDQSMAGMRPNQRVADLVAYSVSPNYFAIRNHLGVAVAT